MEIVYCLSDPFKLIVEGDKLYGRGTTDCLGHVALLTDLFAQVTFTFAFVCFVCVSFPCMVDLLTASIHFVICSVVCLLVS